MTTHFYALWAELPFSLAAPWVLPAIAGTIGLVIGLLVRSSGAKSGRFMRAFTALLLAVVVFGMFKYWHVAKLLNDANPTQRFEVDSPDIMISVMANGVKSDWRAEGKPVPGAARQDDPTAPVKEQYAESIWEEATKRWEALSEKEQLARIDEHQRAVNEVWAIAASQNERTLDWPTFQKSLVPLDGAWLGLAAVLAVVIAASRARISDATPAQNPDASQPAK